jgi:hypothetical protein
MASARMAWASSGVISGSGFAMAKITGSGAMLSDHLGRDRALDRDAEKTSAPFIASSSVRISVLTAWADFHWFMPSVRPCQMTPLVSTTMQFCGRAPIVFRSSMQAIPAAPAPFRTIFTSSIFLPVRCSALMRPAAQITAVPCWSSWKTGMSSCSFSALLDDEALGRLDVLEVDAAEGRGHEADGLDEGVGVLGVELDVDRVHVGEALEEDRLALHHRLRGQRAEVAEAEDRGAVRDDGDEVALGRVVVGGSGWAAISSQGTATPGE